MVSYTMVNAVDWLRDFQKEHGMSDYALVSGDDGKTYQVKFNSSNSKELIAHYIASSIGVPIPSAKIIFIKDDLFDDIHSKLPTISKSPSDNYFAMEWQANTVKWATYDEFIDEMSYVENFDEFLSIFPFDQYLRNYDRHKDNHLIVKKDSKKKFYNTIDADRIMAGKSFLNILDELEKFDCLYLLYGSVCGSLLYDLVEDSDFTDIIKYSNSISIITKEDIRDLLDICEALYSISNVEKDNIDTFLIQRKDKIFDACLSNAKCYPKVKRSLYAN